MGLFDKVKKAGSEMKKNFDLKEKAMKREEFTDEERAFFVKKNEMSPEVYHDKTVQDQIQRERDKAVKKENQRVDEIINPKRHFKSTKSSNNIQVDTVHGTWRIRNSMNTGSIYLYEELLSYNLSTNGHSQIEGGTSVGGALIGGALFGPAGAIIGGTGGKKKQQNKIERIEINIHVDGTVRNTRSISIYKGSAITEKSARSYFKIAESDLSILDYINQALPPERNTEKKEFEPLPNIAERNSEKVEETIETEEISSDLSELRELKSLLDDGIITQEEFDAKKKELLGL